MKINPVAWFIQTILLAGLTLLLLFIILSGSVNSFPFNRFYWLQADTSAISGAPNTSRWTFWGLTENINGKNKKVDLSPAYPISPVDNFGTTQNVPSSFIDNRDTYFYLSRFAFAFFWIAFGLSCVSLALSLFELCSFSLLRLNSFFITTVFFFTAAAGSFITATIVMAKNAFSDDDKDTSIGVKNMSLTWTSVFIAIILFFIAWSSYITTSYKKYRARTAAAKGQQIPTQQEQVYPEEQTDLDTAVQEDPYAQHQQQPAEKTGSGIKFFKIRRSKPSDQESV